MKNPNGFGSIRHLKGKRRKPYMVEKTLGYHIVNPDAPPEEQKMKRDYYIVGYYHTRKEAMMALAEYNKTPTSTENWTFERIFKEWSTNRSTANYDSAYKYFTPLYQKRFKDLKTMDLEQTILKSDAPPSTKHKMKILLNQLYKYALKYDIVSIDYASRFAIESPKPKIVRHLYTHEEITALKANMDSPVARITLVQLYSGMRISEVLTCEIDRENNLFKGGVKTKAGKNRIIPIHSAIQDIEFPQHWTKNVFQKEFDKFKKKMNMEHTSHDARVTFISKADGLMSDTTLKLLVGHEIHDVTKKVYTKKTIDELREAIEKICYEPCYEPVTNESDLKPSKDF